MSNEKYLAMLKKRAKEIRRELDNMMMSDDRDMVEELVGIELMLHGILPVKTA